MRRLTITILLVTLLLTTLAISTWWFGPYLDLDTRSFFRLDTDHLASCRDRQTLFTVSPLALEQVNHIVPLGNLSPTSGHVFPTDHISFFTTNSNDNLGSNQSSRLTIFAPGDVLLTKVSYIEYHHGDQIIDRDYAFYFKPCLEVEASLYHVKSLSLALDSELASRFKLDKKYQTGNITQQRYEARTNLTLKAGQAIGAAGSSYQTQVLDFRAIDTRTDPLAYANPSRWEKPLRHIICPLDYYPSSLQAKFSALLGNGDQPRTTPPLCGTITQDLATTVQGVWFAEKTDNTYPEDHHLALVHDNIDPTWPVFSIGTSMRKSDLAPGLYYFQPRETGTINRDFNAAIKLGQVYCYQGLQNKWGERVNKVIMLTKVNDITLHLEARPGLSCVGVDPVFSDRLTVFER